ncbi:hypothetical protein QAD02_011558 [Eretmocerus hayati]|uniref:Uncharacterized protein n=1 Tax=Eretmocerus hayati TaxID=131215 RepID=A0ACC2NXC6_9HYME|nr:hypothetical protein QAD02_011558 [Eretmocerus hayati]
MEETDDHPDLPRVLVKGSNMAKVKDIVTNMGAKFVSQHPGVEHHVLDIDNKYYAAQILLCATDTSTVDSLDYEAMIFHFDIQTGESLRRIDEEIAPLLAESDPEILLLVCDSISDSATRQKAIEWCAAKKFELIELEPSSSDEDMDLEDDQGKFGIERMIEALETHMWPNITMKDSKPNIPVSRTSEVDEVEDQLENVRLNTSQNFSDRLQMESVLDGIMNSEEADFGELFSQLKAMKEHTASMPSNQRKVAAEQLVTAFWRAIGGDPSEIDDTD